MIKNRSLQVKVVKDADSGAGGGTGASVDYHDLAQTVAKNAIKVIVVYVAADTVRRAAIYGLSSI